MSYIRVSSNHKKKSLDLHYRRAIWYWNPRWLGDLSLLGNPRLRMGSGDPATTARWHEHFIVPPHRAANDRYLVRYGSMAQSWIILINTDYYWPILINIHQCWLSLTEIHEYWWVIEAAFCYTCFYPPPKAHECLGTKNYGYRSGLGFTKV